LTLRRGLLRALARLAAAAAAGALLLAATGCGRHRDADPQTRAVPASAHGGAAPFSILAGSELKELEPAIVAAGHDAGVEVRLSYAGTLDIVERVNAGERFDAILPPNGAYPVLALEAKPLARDKLFYSRVALGVKPAALAALGWDRKPPSWADIAQAAGAGRLRYAMTNPTSSNTGMSALFAVASASAGKSEDLAVQDVDERTLKAFLAGQKLTAGSSGWLADAFVQAPAALDAMVNYEAVILRANAKLAPADRLTLVYPRDGMISADYPLMLLNAERRDAYAALVAALKAPAFQRDALAPAFIRPSNPDVAPAPALPRDAVAELSFPNRLDVIDAVLSAYQAQWRRPATSIFVLDVSGSMRGPRLQAVRAALKVLAGADASSASARYAAFQHRERIVLLPFDDKVDAPTWVRFDGADVEAARARVRAVADGLEARGGTAIFSAIATAEELARDELRKDPDRFVSIVLLTDGESNAGLSLKDFRERYAGSTPARVFPILFGEGNPAEMQALALLSGGREFDGRHASLALVFKDIRGYQ
jgi:Ca-activated chloride channel family protein